MWNSWLERLSIQVSGFRNKYKSRKKLKFGRGIKLNLNLRDSIKTELYEKRRLDYIVRTKKISFPLKDIYWSQLMFDRQQWQCRTLTNLSLWLTQIDLWFCISVIAYQYLRTDWLYPKHWCDFFLYSWIMFSVSFKGIWYICISHSRA